MKILMDKDVSYLKVRCDVFQAYVLQAAGVALWFSSCAGISSVQYEPVVCLGTQLRSESFGQVALDGFYSCAV